MARPGTSAWLVKELCVKYASFKHLVLGDQQQLFKKSVTERNDMKAFFCLHFQEFRKMPTKDHADGGHGEGEGHCDPDLVFSGR